MNSLKIKGWSRNVGKTLSLYRLTADQEIIHSLLILLGILIIGTCGCSQELASVKDETKRAKIPVDKPLAGESIFRIKTQDAFSLGLSEDGCVNSLKCEGRDCAWPPAEPESGLWIEDPLLDKRYRVTGGLSMERGSVKQECIIESGGLKVKADYIPRGNYILVRGEVEDLTRKDRAIDLCFGLPVNAVGCKWYDNILSAGKIESNGSYTGELYPFATLSDRSGKTGLSLAIPPGNPCVFVFSYDSKRGLFALRIRYGLSTATKEKFRSKAPFSFIIYRSDSLWGFRDALRRYYGFFPEIFTRRALKNGAWLTGDLERKKAFRLEWYGYRETGKVGKDVKTIPEFEKTQGWDMIKPYGIYACPYIIVGQKEITHLPRLPGSYEEAMDYFSSWKASPIRFSSPGCCNVFRSSDELKEIIRNSNLHNSHGKSTINIRNTRWGGNSVTFVLNPDPDLFIDTDKMTIAKFMLNYYVKEFVENSCYLGGIYVDSLAKWGYNLNFRREHFKYTDIPPTYDPATLKVALHNKLSQVEFLRKLGDYLHPRGKIVFGNGIRRGRIWNAFYCDVLGVEIRAKSLLKNMAPVIFIRTAAYHKPCLMLSYRNWWEDSEEAEEYWRRSLLYNIYPSTHLQHASGALYAEKYIPLMRILGKVGWEPVPYALSSDQEVLVERYGSGKEGLYFVLFNSAAKKKEISLSVFQEKLKVKIESLEDILNKRSINFTTEEGVIKAKIPMQAKMLRLVRVTAK